MKISKYYVAEDHALHSLIAEINTLIVEGWQPFGGLQVVTPVLRDEEVAPSYAQAMVKYTDDAEH